MIQFEEHTFQMGWKKNHQLDEVSLKNRGSRFDQVMWVNGQPWREGLGHMTQSLCQRWICKKRKKRL